MQTTIVYEDKDILVARKPAGLATQTAKVGQQDMVSELKNYLAAGQKGKLPYLGVVHRLDQPVEGLLVFAKNRTAAAALTRQLGEGTLNKQYYAVVCGKVTKMQGELVDYLYKDGTGRARIVTGQRHDGQSGLGEPRISQKQKTFQEQKPSQEQKMAKKAVLKYRIIKEISTTPNLYLADIHIDTGRFHQIRAQMAHAGMPLLGDTKYGNEASVALGRTMGIRNVALCACQLELIHPVTGKKLSFQAEPEGKAFHI